ncbi:unnamed protein product [Larinioides sclopetarius]|uniref:Uncharacterized protein n=1 Tax=Larinioides sclopetarius TaxID=280406 RepID=A0AAV1Z3F7_9ARAC
MSRFLTIDSRKPFHLSLRTSSRVSFCPETRKSSDRLSRNPVFLRLHRVCFWNECRCAGRTPTCSAHAGGRTDCRYLSQHAPSSSEAHPFEDSTGRERKIRLLEEKIELDLRSVRPHRNHPSSATRCIVPSTGRIICPATIASNRTVFNKLYKMLLCSFSLILKQFNFKTSQELI